LNNHIFVNVILIAPLGVESAVVSMLQMCLM